MPLLIRGCPCRAVAGVAAGHNAHGPLSPIRTTPTTGCFLGSRARHIKSAQQPPGVNQMPKDIRRRGAAFMEPLPALVIPRRALAAAEPPPFLVRLAGCSCRCGLGCKSRRGLSHSFQRNLRGSCRRDLGCLCWLELRCSCRRELGCRSCRQDLGFSCRQ